MVVASRPVIGVGKDKGERCVRNGDIEGTTGHAILFFGDTATAVNATTATADPGLMQSVNWGRAMCDNGTMCRRSQGRSQPSGPTGEGRGGGKGGWDPLVDDPVPGLRGGGGGLQFIGTDVPPDASFWTAPGQALQSPFACDPPAPENPMATSGIPSFAVLLLVLDTPFAVTVQGPGSIATPGRGGGAPSLFPKPPPPPGAGPTKATSHAHSKHLPPLHPRLRPPVHTTSLVVEGGGCLSSVHPNQKRPRRLPESCGRLLAGCCYPGHKQVSKGTIHTCTSWHAYAVMCGSSNDIHDRPFLPAFPITLALA